MKSHLSILSCIAALVLAGCADSKVICGQEIDPAGLIRKENQHVKYELSVGNLIWGVALMDTIAMPVYVFGWAINEPMRLKKGHSCEMLHAEIEQ